MSKEKLVWMPLYIADYLKDTRHLSTEEHGAYFLLIMHAWTHDGLLPLDETRLARITGLQPKEWKACRDIILEFFQHTDEGYRHSRIDLEMQKGEASVEQRRAAGKASAEARKAKRGVNENPTAVQRPLQRDGNETPDNHNHNHIASSEATASAPVDFAEVMKQACRTAGIEIPDPQRHFGKHSDAIAVVHEWVDSGASPGLILSTIERRAASAKTPPHSLKWFDGAVREAISSRAQAASEGDRLADRILAEAAKRKAAA